MMMLSIIGAAALGWCFALLLIELTEGDGE
jgi:hypothetical protein